MAWERKPKRVEQETGKEAKDTTIEPAYNSGKQGSNDQYCGPCSQWYSPGDNSHEGH